MKIIYPLQAIKAFFKKNYFHPSVQFYGKYGGNSRWISVSFRASLPSPWFCYQTPPDDHSGSHQRLKAACQPVMSLIRHGLGRCRVMQDDLFLESHPSLESRNDLQFGLGCFYSILEWVWAALGMGDGQTEQWREGLPFGLGSVGNVCLVETQRAVHTSS